MERASAPALSGEESVDCVNRGELLLKKFCPSGQAGNFLICGIQKKAQTGYKVYATVEKETSLIVGDFAPWMYLVMSLENFDEERKK